MQSVVHVFPSIAELSESVSNHILSLSSSSSDSRLYRVAISGGSLPALVLSSPALRTHLSSSSTCHIYFVDERYCPLDHADSNYRVVHQLIPTAHLHPIQYPSHDLVHCATEYAMNVKEFEFDLVLLGMGPDGHTASLFPNHHLITSLEEEDVQYVQDSPKPPPQRITLSLSKIKRAKRVIFVCTGESKKESLKLAIQGEPTSSVPASLIRGEHVEWFVDQSAAQLL